MILSFILLVWVKDPHDGRGCKANLRVNYACRTCGCNYNTTEVVQMVVDTAITMTDLLMTPPYRVCRWEFVASACFMVGSSGGASESVRPGER